ncbi:hypothetical protein LCGC14_0863960 [marine sediment metagenome]|uniref:Uncharacterized protein n=1 Tax=marine sediment metagenome TaxID=412755 RepID=A0A0F9PS33_9ZZZZ
MAAAVKAKIAATLTVDETLALGLDNADDPTFTHTLGADAATLTSSTTPPVTKTYSETINLSGGGATIDLQALTGPNSTTVDFTGLKVQAIKLSCPSTNTEGITVDRGAANPYNLFGEDNGSAEQVEVMPGDVYLVKCGADKREDVDATHSDIQLAGTGTETIKVILVAG